MLRAHGLVGAGAVASLVMAGLTSTAPVQATPTVHQVRSEKGPHRADPAFGGSQRAAAKHEAASRAGKTAASLRLGRSESLVVRNVERDVDGAEHVHYDRTYQGLPVIGGDLIVHESPGGAVRTVSWSSTPKVQVRGDLAATVAPTDARGTGDRKVIYAVNHAPVLAWEGHVQGVDDDGTPVDDLVYTDAKTGKRLGVRHQVMTDTGTGRSLYSGTVGIDIAQASGTWTLTDPVRANHRTYDKAHSASTTRGTLVASTDTSFGNGATSSVESAAVDAHYGAAQTWDMYANVFGRSGIRGDGKAAYSRVHFGTGYENAFWDDACFCMTYGDGGPHTRPLVSLDIAGHEMTHGITSNTAGLNYWGDAGGLNESTSDVMGTMVEFYANRATDPGDYYIAEKVVKVSPGWLRRMDKPSLDGSSVNCYSATVRNLDPHDASGVGNHAFYLLAEGSGSKTIGGLPHSSTTCNGTSVTGIGRDQAAAIWYRALTTYWVSASTYPQAANGMVRAAKDLYGADSSACLETVAAWRGVNAAPTETCAAEPPVTPSGNLVLNPGFEAGTTSWTATTGVIRAASSTYPARSGTKLSRMGGWASSTRHDELKQRVTVPTSKGATLRFWARISSADANATTEPDRLRLYVVGTTSTLVWYGSNWDVTGGVYRLFTADLSRWVGKTVTLRFYSSENGARKTTWLVDDLSLTTN